MNTINVIYFSNRCEPSKQLLMMMQTEKLTQFFHMICTDNNPKIPPQITVTPTIIIRGIPTPYVAGEAFAWLARVKQWKNMMLLKKMNNSQQQFIKTTNNNLLSDGMNVLGFNQNEMSGMSDIFSFFSRNMDQECQEAFPQSYFVCDNLGKDQIITPPLEGGSYRVTKDKATKLNAKQQESLLNDLVNSRKQHDTQLKSTMDQFIKQYNK